MDVESKHSFLVQQPAVVSSTARNILISNEDTEQVLQTAGDCIEGECSLDEVSELLGLLHDAEKDLEGRLDKIMNMVSHLQHLNDKEERKTDEVRGFVKDLLRVFNTEVSATSRPDPTNFQPLSHKSLLVTILET